MGALNIVSKSAAGACIVMSLPLLKSTVSCGALRNDIRKLGYYCKKYIDFSPAFTFPLSEAQCNLRRKHLRKLEDKLLNHRIEFRSFFLPMDLSSLHHNREMPSGFTLYLCVSDVTLPAKGTAHRANRNAGKVG